MLKSKDIADFIEAKISDLRPGETLPVDLHLYFQANAHIMLWHAAGVVITAEALEKYKKRGLESAWIHKSDWETFHKYLHPVLEAPRFDELRAVAVTEPSVDATRITQDEELGGAWDLKKERNQYQELVYTPKFSAKTFLDVIRDEIKNDREKKALVAKSARTLLGELASPSSIEAQHPVTTVVSKIVRDLLIETDGQSQSLLTQLWGVAAFDPELNHGVNVATLAVLFSMAFGKIDEALLSDIGMAGLLHDVGMTRLPYQLSQIPWQLLTPEQMNEYLNHSSYAAELLETYAPEISERVRILIAHHHESQTGSHAHSSMTPAAELAQMIAMADVVDSMCNGLWDGIQRTFLEALIHLENIEKEGANQPLFVPEVFAAVMRWIRGALPKSDQEATSAAG